MKRMDNIKAKFGNIKDEIKEKSIANIGLVDLRKYAAEISSLQDENNTIKEEARYDTKIGTKELGAIFKDSDILWGEMYSILDEVNSALESKNAQISELAKEIARQRNIINMFHDKLDSYTSMAEDDSDLLENKNLDSELEKLCNAELDFEMSKMEKLRKALEEHIDICKGINVDINILRYGGELPKKEVGSKKSKTDDVDNAFVNGLPKEVWDKVFINGFTDETWDSIFAQGPTGEMFDGMFVQGPTKEVYDGMFNDGPTKEVYDGLFAQGPSKEIIDRAFANGDFLSPAPEEEKLEEKLEVTEEPANEEDEEVAELVLPDLGENVQKVEKEIIPVEVTEEPEPVVEEPAALQPEAAPVEEPAPLQTEEAPVEDPAPLETEAAPAETTVAEPVPAEPVVEATPTEPVVEAAPVEEPAPLQTEVAEPAPLDAEPTAQEVAPLEATQAEAVESIQAPVLPDETAPAEPAVEAAPVEAAPAEPVVEAAPVEEPAPLQTEVAEPAPLETEAVPVEEPAALEAAQAEAESQEIDNAMTGFDWDAVFDKIASNDQAQTLTK